MRTIGRASLVVGLGLVGGCAPPAAAPPRLTQAVAEVPSGTVVDTILPPAANVVCVEAVTVPGRDTVLVLARTASGRELVAWGLAEARLLVRVPLAEEPPREAASCASEASSHLRDVLRADDEPLACAPAEGAPVVACALRGALRLVR